MRWALLLALAATARADGKFVSTQVPVVEIPDQQAILVWKDGRERLVIDTAHKGEGDLAWIVPLPAPPRIEPVSPAVFRTLEVVTMPELRDEPAAAWRIGLYLLVALAIVGVIPSRRILARAGAMFLLFVGLSFVFLLLIPKSASLGGVSVLSRSQAGNYETATIQSVDAAALLSWLGQEGFKVAPEIQSGIEEYVRDGWVFSAAKLKSGGSGGRAHPLSFEFETKEPVYPMRLTGTQGRPLSLRLFVLSDRRARCDALATESCYGTGPSEPARGWPGPDEGDIRRIGQAELLRIADGATVLTTLSGDLEPAEMRRDLRLTFEDYVPLAPVVYSEYAARTGAASTAAWLALALLLPCYLAIWIVRERRKGWRHVFHSWVSVGRRGQIVAWCVAIDLGIVAGVVDYATTEIVETRESRPTPRELFNSHYHASRLVSAATPDDIETARKVAAEFWRGRRNPFDGGDVREEPSPGNYGFELRDGKVMYVGYDARGAPVSPEEW